MLDGLMLNILSTKSRGYWEYKKCRKSSPILQCLLCKHAIEE